MSDDWMDAFAPEDLDDPMFERIDAATRVDGRPRRWIAAVLPLFIAAAALLWLVLPTRPPGVAPTHTPTSRFAATGPDIVAPRTQTDIPPQEAAPIVAPDPVGPAVSRAATPPEPRVAEAPSPPSPPPPEPPAAPRPPAKRPGLHLDPGALARVEADTAILDAGTLVYRRDATHEPGVQTVEISEPPLVARPIGTVFTASVVDGYAVVRVVKGEVWVERPDGVPVIGLEPGEEILLFRDGSELLWFSTSGLSPDAAVDALPWKRRKDTHTLVRLLASTRLAARNTQREGGP